MALPVPRPFTEDEPMAREDCIEEPKRGGVLLRARVRGFGGWGLGVRGAVLLRVGVRLQPHHCPIGSP